MTLILCSISKNSMYQLLQPQLDIFLFEIVFPLMCFNDNDQNLWAEDPHEYVRKGYGELGWFFFCTGFWLYELQSLNSISILYICYPDILEDLYSPRTAAIDFVSELVRKRGKGNLQKFIHFIVEIFKRSLILWSIRILSFTSWTL